MHNSALRGLSKVVDFIVIGIIFLTIFIAELSIFLLSGETLFVLSHLFYLPIIYLAYQYPKRGILISVILALTYLAISYWVVLPNLIEIVPTTIQFYVYVSVGIAITFISSEVKSNELKYRSIFNNSGSGVCIIDSKSGHLIESNNQCIGMMSADPVRGDGFEKIWKRPEDLEMFLGWVRSEGTVADHELEIPQSGNVHTFLMSAGLLPNEQIVITMTDITARKQEEEFLRKRELYFRELTEFLPVPVFEIDPTGRLVYSNRIAFTTYGYDEEDFNRGLSALETLIPEEREPALSGIADLIENKRTVAAEFTALRKNGTTFPVMIYSSPILRDGEVVGIRGIIMDLSDRKRFEEQTRENIHNLEFLSRTATEFVELSRDADIFRYISDRLSEIAPEAVNILSQVSEDFSQIHVKATGGLREEHIRACIQHFGSSPEGMSFPLSPRAAGTMRKGILTELLGGIDEATFGVYDPATLREIIDACNIGRVYGVGFASEENLFGAAVLILPKGAPLQNTGLITAFTRQASVALQRKQVDQLVEESEEKYHILFENSLDGICLLNAGIISECNERVFGMTGYSREEVLGKTLADFSPETQADGRASREYVRSKIDLALQGGSQVFPWQILHKSGSTIETQVSLRSVTLQGETYILSTFHDITEQKRTERELKDANKKLSLLSSVTRHDLLNQVTVVLGYLHLAMESDPNIEISHFLEKIKITTQNIQDLLEFARDYEQLGLEVPRWQNVENLLKKLAESKSYLDISFNILTGPLEVYADPLLEKVFFNLIDNSLRHGEHVTTISVSFAPERRILVVEDDGIGIPASKKELIFRRGYGKNTGLGLYLVKAILGITNMDIREAGKEGGGARFEIHIPPEKFRMKS